MERREAMRNVALLFGGALSASTFSVLFDSCSQPEKKDGSKNLFTADQETLITEIADVIIPDTGTPGAKAAGVGSFIAMMVRECYPDDVQKIFVDGLGEVNKLSDSKFKKSFTTLNLEEKNRILRQIADNTIASKKVEEEEFATRADAAKNNNQTVKENRSTEKAKIHFFQLIRELTLLGYFTSEIGATKALAYLPIPGKYDGCVDLKSEQKTWAL